MDSDKEQGREVPLADAQPPEVTVSRDTRRAERVPPGQSRTRKWPVLDASGPPAIDLKSWRLRLGGLVAQPAEWSWDEFAKLPRVKVFADFHCVTRWSRLGNLWEGVSTRELIARAGGVRPEARFVVAYGYDRGWTTNLPLEHFLAEDALVAILHDGESISMEHGGPARLIPHPKRRPIPPPRAPPDFSAHHRTVSGTDRTQALLRRQAYGPRRGDAHRTGMALGVISEIIAPWLPLPG